MSGRSPLQYELQFQESLNKIVDTPWPILRVLIIQNKIDELHHTFSESFLESYLLELYPILRASLDELVNRDDPFWGVDPVTLVKIWTTFRDLSTKFGIDQDEDAGIQDGLLWVIAFMFSHLGEEQKAYQVLREHSDAGLPDGEASNVDADAFLESTPSLPSKIQSWMKQYSSGQSHSSSPDTVNCLFSVNQEGVRIGILSELSLTLYTEYKLGGIDQVRIASHLVDERDVIADQTRDVCNYLKLLKGVKTGIHLRLEYTIDQPRSMITGNSIGLALTLLGRMSQLIYQKNTAFEARVYKDVALTGALNSAGKVQDVDGEGIYDKIEVAFFSAVNTVVVPQNQLELAKQALRNLHNLYPQHNLELIGEHSIDSLLRRKSVVIHQRRKVSIRITQFLRDYANSTILILLGFLVICASVFYFGIVKHPVPDHVTMTENIFEIRNKYGYNLWKSDKISTKSIPQDIKPIVIDKRCAIVDIDGDNEKEVIIGYDKNSISPLYKGNIICYDFKGNARWSSPFGGEVTYGDRKIPNEFRISKVIVEDFNYDGEYEIVCLLAHEFFPTRIISLGSNGEILMDYWHAGRLVDIQAAEVYEGNTSKEIITSGTNNEHNQGVLIVLDPFKSSGASHQISESYKNQDYVTANEIMYIKFPPTDFMNLLGKNQPGDYARNLVINENGNITIYLESRVLTFLDSELDNTIIDSIIYTMNSNWELIFCSPNDYYLTIYKELFPEKEKPDFRGTTKLNRLHELLYWDGTTWKSGFTINKRYMSLLNNYPST